MIDWKEFLEKNKCFHGEMDGKELYVIDIKDLENYFLGEVARITKDFDKFKAKLRAESFGGNYSLLINDSKKFGRLEGQLKVYKELAGVEQ